MKKPLPSHKPRRGRDTLTVDARVTAQGMDILLGSEVFPIRYPDAIWRQYPPDKREMLKDNIALSSTLFVPQMLGRRDIHYLTARPLAEPHLFKNGIYDMPITALSDGASSRAYVHAFFNTRPTFARNSVVCPDSVTFTKAPRSTRCAIVPFSFGKESLLSFALCRELGIEPIPVLFIEPTNTYEHAHKRHLAEAFEQATGSTVHIVDYQAGLLRSGKHFGLRTELGWGLQTTEYCLLSLPFAHALGAEMIVLGNEQSCNDLFTDREGLLVYKAAYDQHIDCMPQQSVLSSLLLGRNITVTSFLEPLYELAITWILHHRYGEIGSFQMSCMADSERARERRWCQHCTKCGYIFALCAACGADSALLGFTENLFDERHSGIYEHLFAYDAQNPLYGSQEELGLAFLLAERKGHAGASIARFSRELGPRFRSEEAKLRRQYLGITEPVSIPDDLWGKLKPLFLEELRAFTRS